MVKQYKFYFRSPLKGLLFIGLILFIAKVGNAQTFNFTTAGAEGPYGPTQAQINDAYKKTLLDGQVQAYDGIQYWTVPASGIWGIRLAGAQGGDWGTSSQGAKGATIYGEFSLSKGQVLKIIVGQKGELGSATGSYLSSPGGGGGSFVAFDDNTPLIVAGGGAGWGNYGIDAKLSIGQAGEDGGSGAGAGGAGGKAGRGGEISARTARGSGGGGFYTNGVNYNRSMEGVAFVNGGYGGDYAKVASQCAGFDGSGGFGGGASTGGSCIVNGGAGGGYSGGGGGANTAAGGGGSYNSGSNQDNIAGNNSGDGYVDIIAVAVSSTDIAVVDVRAISPVANSLCYNVGYEVEVSLKNNGPEVPFFISFDISMDGANTINVVNYDISDLGVNQTKKYRISEKLIPTKIGSFDLNVVLAEDEDVSNNKLGVKHTVKDLPSGASFSPDGSQFPGSVGDKDFLPDTVTYGKKYRYNMSPPSGLTNSGYSSTWKSNFFAYIGGNALKTNRYTYFPPQGSNNAYVTFELEEEDIDKTIEFVFETTEVATACVNSFSRLARVVPMPKVNFEDVGGCMNTTLQFVNMTTIASGFIAKSEWKWADGTPNSTLFSPDKVFSKEGTYKVKLIATSNFGFKDSIIKDVKIVKSPVVDFLFENNCGNVPFSFDNKSSLQGETLSFTWDFGDGTAYSTETHPSHLYTNPGPYNVTLMVVSESGCEASLTKAAYSYPAPNADFTVPASVCTNEEFNVTNNTSIAFSNWGSKWIVGNNESTQITKEPTVSFNTSGENQLTLIVTTQFGCTDTVTKIINVNQGPEINISHSDACSNTPVKFHSGISTPSGLTTVYKWTIDGNLFGQIEPSLTFAEAGNKEVTLEASFSNGCEATKTAMVFVGERPQANFSLADVNCAGNQIEISNNTNISFDKAEYNWNMGDGSIYSDNIPSHFYSNTEVTDYTITLVASSANGVCPDSVSQTIRVGVIPSCDFTMEQDWSYGQRGYVFNVEESDVEYKWYFGDGNVSTERLPIHQYTSDGNYTVRLIATSPEGCQCEKALSNAVQNLSVTGINGELGFNVYPNPSTGIITIENIGLNTVKSIKVSDMLGKIVLNQEFNQDFSETLVDLSSAVDGIYMVSIETTDGQQYLTKIVISK